MKDIESLLGSESEDLLTYESQTISKDQLHLPGPDFVDRIFGPSDRPVPVLRSLQQLFDH
jgi:class I fructose-bisphosphate aldolase